MTKEQQVTKQSLFENGTTDYASPAHLIEQYKAGNCPLGDVQASIESIMEQYAKEQAVEYREWWLKRPLVWKYFPELKGRQPTAESSEELYNQFMKSKEPKQ